MSMMPGSSGVRKGRVTIMKKLVLLVTLVALPITAWAGWEIAFFDDFNRPDGPLGPPWVIAGPDTLQINSGRVICPFDTSYGLVAYTDDESGPSIALELDFSFFGDTDGWFHGWIGGTTESGDTVAYGAELERGLFGLYYYPPESLIVERPFTYEDYNVYSMRLAYDRSTGKASLTIRDTYGVAWDSVGVTGPGSEFSMVYVGIENRSYDDAKWLDNTTMWLEATSGLPEGRSPATPMLSLAAPFPNPSSGRTLISFDVRTSADVSITVSDILGREVMTWDRSNAAPGNHEVSWDATTYDGSLVSPGVYLCTLRAGTETRSRKMVIAR
jgi:hypothetical protein